MATKKPARRKPKETVVAEGLGQFKVVKDKDGYHLRIELQEYQAVKIKKL